MTTPTRDQVVRWSGDAYKNSSDYWNYMTKFAALARADLEATIAEQATEISKLIAAVADHVTVRAEQRLTIIDQGAEIERMKHSEAVMKAYYEQIFQDGGKRIVELRQQLAAEQAYAEQLREAILLVSKEIDAH